MIDFESLKFGDKVYVAKEENHSFRVKKIRMVDAEGIEWYRYDKPRWTFSIEEIVYCGKVTFIEEGEVRFDEDRETQYHFKYPNGQIHYEYNNEYDIDLKEWFHTREEAEARIEELKIMRLGE